MSIGTFRWSLPAGLHGWPDDVNMQTSGIRRTTEHSAASRIDHLLTWLEEQRAYRADSATTGREKKTEASKAVCE